MRCVIPVVSPSVPPELGEPGSERLAPTALAYLNTRSALGIVAAALVAAVACAWLLEGQLRWLAGLALAALTGAALAVELPVMNRLTVRRTSYTLAGDFVYITRGLLVQRSVVIPMRQILNVEAVQGPLLRRFGLSKVKFTCIVEIESLGPLEPGVVADIRAAVVAAHRGDADAGA